MRNSFYLLTLLVFLSSCVEDNSPDTQDTTVIKEEISLLSSEIVLSEKKQIAVFEFESSVAWTIEPINDRASGWCSVEPSSGDAGKASVVVSVNENLDFEDRQAVLLIKAGTCSETFVVSQKQKDALTVTSSRFEISSDGGTVDIDVSSNVEYEIVVPLNCDWVTNTNTKSLSSQSHSFNVAKNESYDSRSVDIMFKEVNGDISEIVTIEQSAIPVIISSQDYIEIDGEGGTISVNITSNVGYDVIIPVECDWINIADTRSVSNDEISFIVSRNESYDSRSVDILFKEVNGDISKIVTIEQSAIPVIISSQDYIEIDGEGGTISVSITSNIGYDVIIPVECDWINIADTRSVSNDEISFIVSRNESYDSRSVVVFEGENGIVYKSIIIEQSGTVVIIPSQDLFNIDSEGAIISLEIQSNCSFDIVMPEVEWIRIIADSRDDVNNKLVLEVLKNDELFSRSERIVFRDLNQLKNVMVEIVQEPQKRLIIQNKQIELNADGGEAEICVEANIPFSVQIPSDYSWIHFSKIIQSGAFQKIVSLVADTNESYDSRNAKVTIIGDYGFTEDITIVQEGKEVKFNVYLNSLNVATASPSVHVGNGVYHVYKSISAEASFSPANSEAEVFFQTNVLGKVNYTSRTESSFKVKNCQYEYYSTIENPVTLEIRAVIRFKGETFYSDWRSYKMSSR